LRAYLDARSFVGLCFWVRGESGGQNLKIKVTDGSHLQKDEALSIGRIAQYVAGGAIDSVWRLAIIPFDKFPAGADLRTLGSILIEPDSVWRGYLELKTLALCKDSKQTPPFSKAEPPTLLERAGKATWVWNTASICHDPSAVKTFVRYLKEEGFTEVFLGLPVRAGHVNMDGSIGIDRAMLAPLVGTLNDNDIQVHALIGDKNFALPEWHSFVMHSIDNIIRYNQESPPKERFSGVHLDVESYLLTGFNGPRKEQILENYLELISSVSDRVHKSKLTVGADIPFWYGLPDEFTHDEDLIRFRNRTKSPYEHILDIVDEVAIMSYRTFASGIDGIVYHSLDKLVYARQIGKKVYVGVETGEVPDEQIVTFRGEHSDAKEVAPSMFHLFGIQRQDSLSLFLTTGAQCNDFLKRLDSLGVDRRTVLHWASDRASEVPGTKLSFATLGRKKLNQVFLESITELGQYASFAGFAIHHSESYRKLSD
jgi:hypothetical protein